MKTIYTVRHGDIDAPKNALGKPLIYPPETPLSDVGIKQLQAVGKKLEKDGIQLDVLLSSPFLRAMQSANILQEMLGVSTVIVISELRDVDPNSWIGYPMEEYAAVQGDIYSYPKSDRQESLAELLARAKRAWELVATIDHQSIGIVSHGDLLSAWDWVIHTPDSTPSYLEMKNRFYLQKGQVAVYSVDQQLRLTDEVRLITVDEVYKSIEGFRRSLLK